MKSLLRFLVMTSLCANFICETQAFGSKPPKPQPPAPPVVPTPPPTPPVAPPTSGGTSVEEIKKIADHSTCRNYSWKNRGEAPLPFVEGIALSFARSLCRQRRAESSAQLMSQKVTGNSDVDAVAWFAPEFDSKNLEISHSGPDTLRSLYTLGIGLAMRESSGQYCEGNDVTAKPPETSSTAEAGLFQFSYDSIDASPELRKIYDEYRADPSKCYLPEFSKGVSCSERPVIGTGAGAEFQSFAKRCPAFSAEYAMITLRVLRKHYGPINRKEAELQVSCNQMLGQVQAFVESLAPNLCDL